MCSPSVLIAEVPKRSLQEGPIEPHLGRGNPELDGLNRYNRQNSYLSYALWATLEEMELSNLKARHIDGELRGNEGTLEPVRLRD